MSQVTVVYIGGFNCQVKEQDIIEFFRNFQIRQNIVLKQGFCFVKFCDIKEAKKACKKLNGQKFFGDIVKVEISKCHDREMWDLGDRGPKAGGQKMPKSPDSNFAWYFNEIKKREDDVKKLEAELKYVITLLPLLLAPF